MQQLLLKDFQQELFYNNDTNVLLIENEISNISLIIKSNIYINNGISTTVNISFKYKTSLENTYKIKSTSINFNYRPVPVTFYLNTDSSKLYIKNFKIEFLYNGKYYETDQDFFRDFNCFNIYTEDNANNYDIYIDTNIGIMDEDSYNSMQHPLMIEAIVDGYIHLMPHNDPIYIEPETPRIWYKINNGDYNELFRENNDNDEVEDILVGHGNLEDDNPFNDYHHYVIPIKQGETIYLFSPNLDRMVLVFFSTKKNEERWDEDIEVEVYNEQQIDDDIDDMTANELLAQIQALNARVQTLESNISGKQNTISDLNTIRSGAALGATAIQSEELNNYIDNKNKYIYNLIYNINNINKDNRSYYEQLPLTFEILESGKIVWKSTDNNINKTIYYKQNNNDWNSITSNPNGSYIDVNKGDIIQFKGNSSTALHNSSYSTFDGTTCTFNIYGNIISLISDNFLIEPNEFIFSNLFKNCINLIDISNLILPQTKTSWSCYNSMFMGCKSLITSPKLLSVSLSPGCYCAMFYHCESLIYPPELPATILDQSCYAHMFADCKSLKFAPNLPAQNLVEECYYEMFRGCISLINAPEINAKIVAPLCCHYMFADCINLITSPSILPAITLANDCYTGMFMDCKSLITAPNLPAINLSTRCYSFMFMGCKSLITAPELPAIYLTIECYEGMFSGCINLKNAPKLSSINLALACYYRMFMNCKSLIIAPELPATTLVQDCYGQMFVNCINLNYIKCLALETNSQDCLDSWVYNISSAGTFIKNTNMNNWPSGISGIPEGWTVEDAT